MQRELVVCADGKRRPALAIVVYRQVMGGRWVREKSISVRKHEVSSVVLGLGLGARVPVVDEGGE